MIEHDLNLLISQQLAEFITTYVVCVGLTEENLYTYYVKNVGVAFATQKQLQYMEENNSEENMIKRNFRYYIAGRVIVRKISRTRYSIAFNFNPLEDKEFSDKLISMVSGYLDVDINGGSGHRDFVSRVNFTLDTGCKSNSINFFKMVLEPEKYFDLEMI